MPVESACVKFMNNNIKKETFATEMRRLADKVNAPEDTLITYLPSLDEIKKRVEEEARKGNYFYREVIDINSAKLSKLGKEEIARVANILLMSKIIGTGLKATNVFCRFGKPHSKHINGFVIDFMIEW